MKKIFYIFFKIIICTNILCAQSEIEYGIGLSYAFQFYQHDDKIRFESEFFKPDIGHSVVLNTYLGLKTTSGFSVRLNLLLGQKKVVLSNKVNVVNTQGITKFSVRHNLIATDLSLLAIYNLNKDKKISTSLILGFYGSANQYISFSQHTNLRGSGLVTQNNGLYVELNTQSEPFITDFGINTGIISDFQLFNRKVEFFSIFYFSPLNFFDANFIYEEDFIEKTVIGKFHFITTGINIPLNKTK
jgi:hypothetical protein